MASSQASVASTSGSMWMMKLAPLGGNGGIAEQRPDDARNVDEHGEGVQVVEQQLVELRALADVQPARSP